jgi:hypothetical protein
VLGVIRGLRRSDPDAAVRAVPPVHADDAARLIEKATAASRAPKTLRVTVERERRTEASEEGAYAPSCMGRRAHHRDARERANDGGNGGEGSENSTTTQISPCDEIRVRRNRTAFRRKPIRRIVHGKEGNHALLSHHEMRRVTLIQSRPVNRGAGSRPSGAARDPRGAESRPSGAARDPRGAGSRPSSASRDPRGAGSRPSGASRDPRGAGSRPSGASRDPRGAGSRPGGASRGPSGAGSRPSGASRDPGGAGSRPSGASRDPRGPGSRPSGASRDPGRAKEARRPPAKILPPRLVRRDL